MASWHRLRVTYRIAQEASDAQQIALPEVTPSTDQQLALHLGFDTFFSQLHAQFVRHHDHGLAKGQFGAARHQVSHEGLVDLQVVDLEALQIRQR